MGMIEDIRSDLESGSAKLIREYRDILYADAVKMIKDPTEAEDLVFRTLEAVVKDLDRFDSSKGSLLTWMRGVLRNQRTLMSRRKVVKSTYPVSPDELEGLIASCDNSTEQEILAHSDSEMLHAAIEALPVKSREAVILHYMMDMPIPKVAEFLRLPVVTVRSRLYFARKILLARLKRTLGGPKIVLVLLLLLGSVALACAGVAVVNLISDAVGDECPMAESPEARGADGRGCNESAFKSTQNQFRQEVQMKLSSMGSAAAVAFSLAAVPLCGSGVTLSVEKVQQRYPWNGLVDIDYSVEMTDADVQLDPLADQLQVLVVNEAAEPFVTNAANVFLQSPLPVAPGRHRITWDANADGFDFVSSNVVIQLSLTHYSTRYMVVDVSDGPEADSYEVSYLNGEPRGGFNVDEYKGDKIVFRLLPPGSLFVGAASNEPSVNNPAAEVQHYVRLTKPFYIGLFEVTQRQYLNVMGGDNPTDAAHLGEFRPVDKVSLEMIRGKTAGVRWPVGGHAEVDESSFLGKLRSRTGVDFDLPTEAQWEYACRAGTVGSFGTNEVATTPQIQTTQMKAMGRFSSNQAEGRGGYTTATTKVGSYQANPWGLYDMHGNIGEWCLDRYVEGVQELRQFVDPVGAESGNTRVVRGGNYVYMPGYCRSASRAYSAQGNAFNTFGFRLARTMP